MYDQNRETITFIKKLESGKATKTEIAEFNSKIIKLIEDAMKKYRKGSR